ncbi:MAG: zf-HC2 domain-containing protein [Acidiferrobacterales bacterium]|nr:zf-HC2 domain-containing protein [Acidiferrobacterales bacterium]
MNKIMNCKISLNLVDDYLGGYLDQDTRQALEEHLEQCASCQAQFAQDKALRQRMQAQLIGQPKAGFADRVLARTVEHHQHQERHHWSFIGGAIAASVVIAVTSFVLRFAAPQPEQAQQTLALNQVTRVALALDSREELKGATITLRLPDNVELKGFPGQRMISWKTDIDRGTNLLALPVKGVAAKNGLLVARLEYGNKSKEYKVELSVKNQDVNGGLTLPGSKRSKA